MPNYRRANVAGGTYFFTVVTANRAPILTSDLALRELRRSVAACRRKRPFELIADVVQGLVKTAYLAKAPKGLVEW